MCALTCWAVFPKAEVQAKAVQYEKFGFDPAALFQERDARYFDFCPEVRSREDIKKTIENHPNVKRTLQDQPCPPEQMVDGGAPGFLGIGKGPENGKSADETKKDCRRRGEYLTLKGTKLPEVRRSLIDSLKPKSPL